MDITEQAILSVLIEEGGQIKNSDLLVKFKGGLNCSDPSEKKQNRDLFKTIINNLAVVKEIDAVKHVVLRKKFQHLLKHRSGDGDEQRDEERGVEQREVCENEDAKEEPSEEIEPEPKASSDTEVGSSPALSFIELALQRQTFPNFKAYKSLHFVTPLKTGPGGEQKHVAACSNASDTSAPKRIALPLRIPPVVITPVVREEMNKPSNDEHPVKVHLAPVSSTPRPPCSPRYKRRSYADSVGISSSPQLRRHCKNVKPADEPKCGGAVPLEISEHRWMVTSASGHWNLVYGLLLDDAQLAEKRDFISGFTALHWAAKCGNANMLRKIIDLSRKNSKGVDINGKSYAGYTPLHVAAIHGQEYVIRILMNEYGADCNVRDNSGKKAHHYLDQCASRSIRELLGGLQVVRAEPQKTAEDTDAHKHTHTISRIFQQQTIGYRKKAKSRSTFLSLAEEVKDEKDEHSNPVHRVFS